MNNLSTLSTGLNLERIRKNLGLTQAQVDLATRELGARVSQSYLSQLENGTKSLLELSPDKIEALRMIYRLTPEDWATATGTRVVSPGDIASMPPALGENEPPPVLQGMSNMLPAPWIRLLAALPIPKFQSFTAGQWLDLYNALKNAGVDPLAVPVVKK